MCAANSFFATHICRRRVLRQPRPPRRRLLSLCLLLPRAPPPPRCRCSTRRGRLWSARAPTGAARRPRSQSRMSGQSMCAPPPATSPVTRLHTQAQRCTPRGRRPRHLPRRSAPPHQTRTQVRPRPGPPAHRHRHTTSAAAGLFIKRVVFQLHPTITPSTRTVEAPPFEVTLLDTQDGFRRSEWRLAGR